MSVTVKQLLEEGVLLQRTVSRLAQKVLEQDARILELEKMLDMEDTENERNRIQAGQAARTQH